jgi:hypothetical protein
LTFWMVRLIFKMHNALVYGSRHTVRTYLKV